MDNGGLPGSSVNLDDLALREWMGMNFVAATVFGTVRSIVVQRDDFLATFFGNKTSMVLEAELDIFSQFEVGFDSTQTPDNFTRGAVDLVDRAGISSRDQVVAF